MPEFVRGEAMIEGRFQCVICKRGFAVSHIWQPQRVCVGCMSTPPPPDDFDKDADLIEELQALGEIVRMF